MEEKHYEINIPCCAFCAESCRGAPAYEKDENNPLLSKREATSHVMSRSLILPQYQASYDSRT
jgi:hypothetical protein